ncbi:MAG: hypothetical protein H0W88_01560 [Parachlamydiaceae bacterium]|nr:hypothetical protein [Parachlamydiaceae bacterium]
MVPAIFNQINKWLLIGIVILSPYLCIEAKNDIQSDCNDYDLTHLMKSKPSTILSLVPDNLPFQFNVFHVIETYIKTSHDSFLNIL